MMIVFLVEKLERSKQMFEKNGKGLASPLSGPGARPNARSIGGAETDLADYLHTAHPMLRIPT